MAIPSQALNFREGVETRQASSLVDEGMVQTTNTYVVVKTIVVKKA